jgi:hypothetical protein
VGRFTRVAGLAAVLLLGVGCGLIASGGPTQPPLPTERVQGDPPLSASFEVQPEGTTPPDVAIAALDVTVRSDLPVPAATDCDGLWVDVHLRSGRVLRYPPCAMPAEIAALRDSSLRAAQQTAP